jgi:hypothetical protein
MDYLEYRNIKRLDKEIYWDGRKCIENAFYFFYDRYKIKQSILNEEFDFSEINGLPFFAYEKSMKNYNNINNEIVIQFYLNDFSRNCDLNEYLIWLQNIDKEKYNNLKKLKDKYKYEFFILKSKMNYYNDFKYIKYNINNDEDENFIKKCFCEKLIK